MARAKSFFSGGLKFNLASVKNNHHYEKKYFECGFGCRVRNITGRATTPDTTLIKDKNKHVQIAVLIFFYHKKL